MNDETVLPMHIEGLMQLTTEKNRALLRNLIALKATVGEKYLHKKDPALHAIAAELFDFLENPKVSLGVNDHNYDLLNEFFLKILHASTNN
jgi:hypothetical protein